MRTTCILCVVATVAAGALAQAPPAASVASLQAAAEQKTAEWQKLAQELTGNISRLLPCDPKVTAAIQAVSKASEDRLAAVAAYLAAAGADINTDAVEAKRLTSAGQSLAADLAAEKTETSLEQAAIDGQRTNLAESVKKLPALSDAQAALQQVQMQAQQRADGIQNGSAQIKLFEGSVSGLASATDSRAAAWKDLQVAYEAERARWNAYYAARLARAQTECSITKGVGGSGSSSRRGKKQ